MRKTASTTPPRELTQPKYAELAQAFLVEIQAGRYPVGSLLPTEEKLCLQYGMSRATVRSALRSLQDRGYVRSQRPLGTRVIAAEVSRRTALSLPSVSELIQLTAATRQMVTSVSDVMADTALAKEIGCRVGRAWRRVELLRWLADGAGAPSMQSQLWINPLYADVTRNIKPNRVTQVKLPYIDLIEQRFGVRAADVRQAISAIGLPSYLEAILKTPAQSPALRVQRWFRASSGTLIMYSSGIYGGSTFKYETTLNVDDSQVS